MDSTEPRFTHLEDFSEDILAKAQNGLRITNRDLADRTGLDLPTIKDLKGGGAAEEPLRKAAEALGLHPERLRQAARREWLPEPTPVAGLRTFVSEFGPMSVNAYLLEAADGSAVLFDTGVEAPPILEAIAGSRLSLAAIVLTHGHPDHVGALAEIVADRPGVPVYAHPEEKVADARPVEWDQSFRAGPFPLRALATPGHTPGGTSFLVEGREPPLCFVGDALFAGSVGGCAADYERALRLVRDNLLALPGETVLCPGHGPRTTVREEREHNPFFPGTDPARA